MINEKWYYISYISKRRRELENIEYLWLLLLLWNNETNTFWVPIYNIQYIGTNT